ncbi:MAG TPA: hypothetical protein VNH18_23005 [Bryobacteraceae bacterium]|nr:hypothetical protein [Bryobacteraceae bacterium]
MHRRTSGGESGTEITRLGVSIINQHHWESGPRSGERTGWQGRADHHGQCRPDRALQKFTSVSQAKPQSRILTCADPTAIRFGSAPLLSAWSPVILRRVNIGADAMFDQKREGQLATRLHPAGFIERLIA